MMRVLGAMMDAYGVFMGKSVESSLRLVLGGN